MAIDLQRVVLAKVHQLHLLYAGNPIRQYVNVVVVWVGIT